MGKCPKHAHKCSKIYYFDKISSTQVIARDIAQNDALDGTVVIASSQTSGQGRIDRVWESIANKGLYLSIICKPRHINCSINLLPLCAAIAVVKTIYQISDLNAKIKWPNDIKINNKKIGGILSEAAILEEKVDYCLIGIGLNVNHNHEEFSDSVRDIATSIRIETNFQYRIEDVFEILLSNFFSWYRKWEKGDNYAVIKEWIKHNCTLGEQIYVLEKGVEICSGLASYIDNNGNLAVKMENGKYELFDYGEVSIKKV